jgi:hypothetical protein
MIRHAYRPSNKAWPLHYAFILPQVCLELLRRYWHFKHRSYSEQECKAVKNEKSR